MSKTHQAQAKKHLAAASKHAKEGRLYSSACSKAYVAIARSMPYAKYKRRAVSKPLRKLITSYNRICSLKRK